MSAAVAILDALRKKPVAEKKKQFSVVFFVASVSKNKAQKERAEEEERVEEREERVEERDARPSNPTVKITDKASLKLVNRDDILAKIKAARFNTCLRFRKCHIHFA